jgi:hypothetical protein
LAANQQFDFGFRQIFTPELLGNGAAQAGAVKDFALDGVSDAHSLTASVTQGSALTLCNWATDLQSGDIQQTVCTTHHLLGLAASPRELPPTALDLVRAGALFSDGDYLLGRHENGQLVLRLWRVGQRG